jgi:hypothetical protein
MGGALLALPAACGDRVVDSGGGVSPGETVVRVYQVGSVVRIER